ncbi:hypothetical protein L873DRAFT_1820853 [Choiromyces venosus 120613-1]|uniref:Uncharacterized protein n=1 Tax=Choiromyces venosus 120613-1 TaxID=1336337 RepID=A0A3N4J2C5_9PEZI|nr:hypothetical protein L873DRAFT_1820853 [Choiromyces venosus 120613-1]
MYTNCLKDGQAGKKSSVLLRLTGKHKLELEPYKSTPTDKVGRPKTSRINASHPSRNERYERGEEKKEKSGRKKVML